MCIKMSLKKGGETFAPNFPANDNISYIAHYVIFEKLLEYSFSDYHGIKLL